MIKFTVEEIEALCTKEEADKLGAIIFDNCTIRERQEVISMFLQERKKHLNILHILVDKS
jgi:hypothetical protein